MWWPVLAAFLGAGIASYSLVLAAILIILMAMGSAIIALWDLRQK